MFLRKIDHLTCTFTQNFSGRTIRVSVAEPPKERPGFGSAASYDDGAKFEDPWRRGGPLPDLTNSSNSRDSSRRRFDGPRSTEERLPSLSEGPSDWRSSRPVRAAPVDNDGPGGTGPSPPGSIRRNKGPSFLEGGGAADREDTWTIGSKFKPSAPVSAFGSGDRATSFGGGGGFSGAGSGDDERSAGKDSKFGSLRGRGDMGPPKEIPEESDWRSSTRRPAVGKSSGTSRE